MSEVLFGALFLGAALMALGLVFDLVYEGLALITRKVPTISAITTNQLLTHPRMGRVLYFISGVVLGALATHFAHWTP